jgi:RNA polymerase sigma factor (TIGR02999 family)
LTKITRLNMLRASYRGKILSTKKDADMASQAHQVTQLLIDWNNGDKAAVDKLMPVIYVELRALAARYLSKERVGHTLQPTALVHEAYLQLVETSRVNWQNRAHFFGAASRLMRHILVDHARSHQAAKRGAGLKVSISDEMAATQPRELDLVALDDALNLLAELDPQQSRIVELKFFGGLSIEEIAEALSISPATVKRHWASAKAWLNRQLTKDSRQ